MLYKLTLDINLIGASAPKEKDPAMKTLERWKTEGKVELCEANPPKIPDNVQAWAAPKTAAESKQALRDKRNRPQKKSESGGVTFKSVAGVLFPAKDPQKLNMTEVNDVAHLIKHHNSKNEIFVTLNTKDFIEGGRRELLSAYFKIIAMTPDETVKMLGGLEGWK